MAVPRLRPAVGPTLTRKAAPGLVEKSQPRLLGTLEKPLGDRISRSRAPRRGVAAGEGPSAVDEG